MSQYLVVGNVRIALAYTIWRANYTAPTVVFDVSGKYQEVLDTLRRGGFERFDVTGYSHSFPDNMYRADVEGHSWVSIVALFEHFPDLVRLFTDADLHGVTQHLPRTQFDGTAVLPAISKELLRRELVAGESECL